ncbi:MAG: MerR family DNA-binding transcriptional regulator, partial [Planctomycetota bacterium]|nr:MerR family DNA-binding transcriptional regulator [Planctomycetota bacterium]
MSKTDHVSIASVSRETGIGIETLRQWERRYGKPAPVRLPSGHRRY